MQKIISFLKLILRSKILFKTPKKHDLVVFDDESMRDLHICLLKFNFFVLQTRMGKRGEDRKYTETNKFYFSYKILKKIFKNFSKGNLFTVYLVSLIELINPKVVITTIDNSFKFSEISKILEEKINFIAIQSCLAHDFLLWNYLYNTKKIEQDFAKQLYIPNLFCMGGHDIELWKQHDIKVKNFYPIGNLRVANFFYHIKSENNSSEKYNSDICLVHGSHKSEGVEESFVKIIKYTIKFCLKHKMKLIIPLKRDKKYLPSHYKVEIEYFDRCFDKKELDYIKKSILENDLDDFSSYRALLNSKVAVAMVSTLLRNKLSMGGKVLSCNFTKYDIWDLQVNGICSIKNCSYEEFEKRLLDIYSMSKDDYFSKINIKPDYLDKFSNNYSTINLVREKLSEFGVKQK